MRFNIRCCCVPVKILGSIEIPGSYQESCEFVIHVAPILTSWKTVDPEDLVKPQPLLPVTVKLQRFGQFNFTTGQYEYELAVYSDDRPVTYWQQFPSFVPAP